MQVALKVFQDVFQAALVGGHAPGGQHEDVAVQARHQQPWSPVHEPGGQMYQQRVAGRAPQGGGQGREAADVEGQQRHRSASIQGGCLCQVCQVCRSARCQKLLAQCRQPAPQSRAVQQAGQGVVLGVVAQTCFHPAQGGHVAQGEHQAGALPLQAGQQAHAQPHRVLHPGGVEKRHLLLGRHGFALPVLVIQPLEICAEHLHAQVSEQFAQSRPGQAGRLGTQQIGGLLTGERDLASGVHDQGGLAAAGQNLGDQAALHRALLLQFTQRREVVALGDEQRRGRMAGRTHAMNPVVVNPVTVKTEPQHPAAHGLNVGSRRLPACRLLDQCPDGDARLGCPAGPVPEGRAQQHGRQARAAERCPTQGHQGAAGVLHQALRVQDGHHHAAVVEQAVELFGQVAFVAGVLAGPEHAHALRVEVGPGLAAQPQGLALCARTAQALQRQADRLTRQRTFQQVGQLLPGREHLPHAAPQYLPVLKAVQRQEMAADLSEVQLTVQPRHWSGQVGQQQPGVLPLTAVPGRSEQQVEQRRYAVR